MSPKLCKYMGRCVSIGGVSHGKMCVSHLGKKGVFHGKKGCQVSHRGVSHRGRGTCDIGEGACPIGEGHIS